MSVQPLELDQIVMQSDGFLASNMNDEKVMMSVESGKYYNLGSIGGRIWELIESPTSVRQVVTSLREEYEIDQDACERQVLSFLQTMLTEKLIRTGT
ncbi:lasso peptide biosynthesis PqqD family chaperone [Paenibacillus oceani]|uniref:Lasso peptide biosynthesis PqqD family chaperone n=1 Tax=Paenibacillus oceani TaxID=2772510 RepID=A0A927CFH7_9BACL|nr:lasso peptide biosynthesis PqqD family chaperone [Paenibacillus oceani]MBD2866514.1 lasso peptide biosynthesis PqqD family chaperone [Paenibacillus oceani]